MGVALYRSAIGLVILAALLTLLGQRFLPPFALTERWLADFRIATLAVPESPRDDIVVVTINEDTLRQFPYRSPVDRGFLADVIATIDSKGAQAIAVDLLFDQPTEDAKDLRLARQLVSSRARILVAFAGVDEGLTEEQAVWLSNFVPPELRTFANLAKDPLDGTARWIYPGKQWDGVFVSGMASALANVSIDPKATLPAIRWRSATNDHPFGFVAFPAHLVELLPASWFANKMVLIGTDISLADRHRTPFSTIRGGDAGLMPGVLVHAQEVATLLDPRPARELSLAANAAVTLLAALVAALIFRLSWGLPLRIILAGGLIALGWVSAFAMFRYADLQVPLLAPTVAFALAAWGLEVIGHRDAQQNRRFLKQAFAQYISPELVEQLLANPNMLSLSGERREMTFLFSDVANFTPLAESMDAATLTKVLNDYLDGVCAAVFANGGTITDFIGDAVFATFGAPVPHADHRLRATACAGAIDRFSRDFQARMNQQGISFCNTRIGIHSGIATIGNIGSSRHFKYAPVGDAVNTASRIEGLNKYFSTSICLSETSLTDGIRSLCRPIGHVVLKGRKSALAMYEMMQEDVARESWVEDYRRAYSLMEADDPAADKSIGDLAALRPSDGLIAYHLERIKCGKRIPLIVMADK
jgi:class 3 adenylate cyclase/CHASE2 domain-containing sensor protein